MKIHFRWLPAAAMLLALGVAVGAQEQPAAEAPAGAEKMAKLLEGTGLTHNKVNPSMWTVPFDGETRKDFNVVVALSGDGNLVVVFALLVEKAQMKPSDELWKQLLRANDAFDRVKVGIDDEDDAFIRIDLTLRVLDADELKANIEQVAAATDEIFTALQPHLTTPPPAPAAQD